MFKTIIVPLDGSPLAERAVPFAVRLARAAGGELLLTRAISTASAAVVTNASATRIAGARLAVERRTAEAELAAAAARLRDDGVASTARVEVGGAASVILGVAQPNDAHLIVMSTHGRSGFGRYIYGSVADEVLRQAEVPVLLVPPICEAPWPTERPLRVLVPLDGSDLAEEALGPASQVADTLSADLVLLQVVRTDATPELDDAIAYLTAVAAPLRAAGRAVAVRAVVGTPAAAIAAVAHDEEADLIAMASHGRGGVVRFVLGSVAIGTLQRTPVPVLLVRSPTIQAATTAAAEPDRHALYALLVEQAPDAVVFAGTDGIIQAWNGAATVLFGYAPAEAIGQNLDLIIPEQFRDAHWKGYKRALEVGDTKYRGKALPTRAVKANGEMLYIELCFAIIHDPSGTVIGALAHARDITARFEHDRASRRQLRDLEQELETLRGRDRRPS